MMRDKLAIRKGLLDELIRLTRKYRETGDVDILPAKNKCAFELSRATFGNENRWLPLADLCSAVIGTNGLATAATNEYMYEIFNLLGYAIIEGDAAKQES